LILFIINALKIIFLLGFLIFIHEGGHFLVAKLMKVRVNEFAIGFGPTIWSKQGEETKYAIRLIPLGGFVSMEGEMEESKVKGSFSEASIPRRIAIVLAGAFVNIVFGIVVYFILMSTIGLKFENSADDTFLNRIYYGWQSTTQLLNAMFESIKGIFTASVGVDQFTGIVGISEIVVETTKFYEYIYYLAVISVSLGITNLLPIPALDGGKIVFLIIEAIRKKPLKVETEAKIQLIGFSLLIGLSIYVTYNDILRIF